MKLKLYSNTQGQYSFLLATFSSQVKGKKLPYHYRSRSSTIKAISDFLVTIYKFYPRHTVPTDQRLSTDFNNSRLNEEKNHTYRLLALYQGTKGKRIRKTRANSLALISLWSYLKGEKRQSEEEPNNEFHVLLLTIVHSQFVKDLFKARGSKYALATVYNVLPSPLLITFSRTPSQSLTLLNQLMGLIGTLCEEFSSNKAVEN